MPPIGEKLLIGMVHLPPLPGSPGYCGDFDAVIEHALTDAKTLTDSNASPNGGFKYVMIENFGDAPFTGGAIEPATVAAMAIIVREVKRSTGAMVGVNCLRNDARSALGIAAACGAHMIRVNVHTGVYATDQGVIEGRAYETVRLRDRLAPSVRIFADVHVKHATPINQPDIAQAAEETAYRGKADAIIVSGSATGKPVDLDELAKVKAAVPDKPVLVGSGATPETITKILGLADGAIVGSALKPGGDINATISRDRVQAFLVAATANLI